jgi:hypothetical protein
MARRGNSGRERGFPAILIWRFLSIEDLEALAGLPLLIGHFAPGGLEKAVIVGNG